MTDRSSGGDGGKLREDSEMMRVSNIKKSLRQDHSPLVTSVVRVDPSSFTVLTWCSERERERDRMGERRVV